MRNTFIFTALFGLACALVTALGADTVYLKSGEQVEGVVVAESERSVMVQNDAGGFQKYSVDEVVKIEKNVVEEADTEIRKDTRRMLKDGLEKPDDSLVGSEDAAWKKKVLRKSKEMLEASRSSFVKEGRRLLSESINVLFLALYPIILVVIIRLFAFVVKSRFVKKEKSST